MVINSGDSKMYWHWCKQFRIVIKVEIPIVLNYSNATTSHCKSQVGFRTNLAYVYVVLFFLTLLLVFKMFSIVCNKLLIDIRKMSEKCTIYVLIFVQKIFKKCYLKKVRLLGTHTTHIHNTADLFKI